MRLLRALSYSSSDEYRLRLLNSSRSIVLVLCSDVALCEVGRGDCFPDVAERLLSEVPVSYLSAIPDPPFLRDSSVFGLASEACFNKLSYLHIVSYYRSIFKTRKRKIIKF